MLVNNPEQRASQLRGDAGPREPLRGRHGHVLQCAARHAGDGAADRTALRGHQPHVQRVPEAASWDDRIASHRTPQEDRGKATHYSRPRSTVQCAA